MHVLLVWTKDPIIHGHGKAGVIKYLCGIEFKACHVFVQLAVKIWLFSCLCEEEQLQNALVALWFQFYDFDKNCGEIMVVLDNLSSHHNSMVDGFVESYRCVFLPPC